MVKKGGFYDVASFRREMSSFDPSVNAMPDDQIQEIVDENKRQGNRVNLHHMAAEESADKLARTNRELAAAQAELTRINEMKTTASREAAAQAFSNKYNIDKPSFNHQMNNYELAQLKQAVRDELNLEIERKKYREYIDVLLKQDVKTSRKSTSVKKTPRRSSRSVKKTVRKSAKVKKSVKKTRKGKR